MFHARLRWRAQRAHNGEPGGCPVGLCSIRRTVTPAFSAVIDHISARARLCCLHLPERCWEVLLYTFRFWQKKESHHDSFFLSFSFQGKVARGKKREGKKCPSGRPFSLLCHRSGLISALIVDFFFAHSQEPGNITEVKPCLVTYALTWKGKRGSEWVKSS